MVHEIQPFGLRTSSFQQTRQTYLRSFDGSTLAIRKKNYPASKNYRDRPSFVDLPNICKSVSTIFSFTSNTYILSIDTEASDKVK